MAVTHYYPQRATPGAAAPCGWTGGPVDTLQHLEHGTAYPRWVNCERCKASDLYRAGVVAMLLGGDSAPKLYE